ncbi:MAG: MFS transporter [Candidatus Rokubacteria bacterium]|nr:MFS transporter [Candidatus Rokubacteria bacterium]
MSDARFLAGICCVLGTRQLALLVALPFIAIHGQDLAHSTPALIGLALGIYGLLQGLLQIPFGRWSDAVGRKRVVLLGTAALIVGLVVSAVATDIVWFVIGRALQGAGAITGVAYAWIADHTADDRRSRAMGVAGLAVAGAALVSFVVGPLLYRVLSVPQIFLVCAALVTLVWIFVLLGMRDAAAAPPDVAARRPLGAILRMTELRRLVVVGFLVNYLFTAVCFVVPLVLAESLGARELWKALIPAALVGIVAMRVATRRADAGRFASTAAACCAAVLPIVPGLWIGHPLAVTIGTASFMAGYLGLTALVPAAVTSLAGERARGTASGVYNSALFFGSFAGGTLTGILWGVRPSLATYAMLAAWAAAQLAMLRVPDPARAAAQ